jgi:hypothetical protein
VFRPRVVFGSGVTMMKIILKDRLGLGSSAPLPRAVKLDESRA